ALRAAAAVKTGAQTTRRRATLTTQRSTVLATNPTFGARWRRYEFVWYVTTAVVAVGIGVVLAAWLNGGWPLRGVEPAAPPAWGRIKRTAKGRTLPAEVNREKTFTVNKGTPAS